jgi:hypothetical protein
MEKYNINHNRPSLTQEQIENGFNFSKIKEMASTKTQGSFYKAMIAGIGMALLILSPVIINHNSKQNNKLSSATDSSTYQTNTSTKIQTRPFPDIPITYEEFTINGNENISIKTKSGSIIIIEKNSIVDSLGNAVEGNINLKYREFRDMVDVFLAGIPMEYDSAGYKNHFESAGMFELLAYKNNKTLFIKSDKTITIEFVSNYTGNQYNMYYFNTQTQQWEYMCKDTSKSENKVPTNNIEALTNEIDMLKKSIPLKPVLANPKQPVIKLDVLEQEFPEIAIYKNVCFQVNDYKKINPAFDTIEWDMVKVERTEQDQYLLHFERGTEVKEFLCKPVFEKQDYLTAKKLFEENYKTSLELIKQKEKIKQELVTKYNKEKTAQQNSLSEVKLMKRMNAVTMSSQDKITRIFQINKFGIFNSDCPKNLPQGSLFALNLVDKDDEEGKTLGIDKVYLVEKNKNALYTYYSINKFSYNPSSKNLLWTVTSDNKLAIFSYDDFSSISTIGKGEEKTLKMNVIPVNFKSEAHIRKYLEL